MQWAEQRWTAWHVRLKSRKKYINTYVLFMRILELSLKLHNYAPFSFEWEHDPVWATRIHIQVKRELLSQTITVTNPLRSQSKILWNCSARLKMRTQNCKKAVFDSRLKCCVGWEKTSQRERDTSYGLASLSGCMRNNGRPLLSMPSNPDAIEVSAAGASWERSRRWFLSNPTRWLIRNSIMQKHGVSLWHIVVHPLGWNSA